MITRSTSEQRFFLRPDSITNNIFTYCLALAAMLFKVDVVMTIVESNHHHTIIFDPYGQFSQFMHYLHTMVARCMNVRWNRSEAFWSVQEPCVTRLLGGATVIEKMIYAASNPVKDGLVRRATEWPGLNGYRALVSGTSIRAKRPKHFFRQHGDRTPEEVTLSLVIPPVLGRPKDVIRAVREGVEQVEQEQRRIRATVLGPAAARTASENASPKNRRTNSGTNLRPRFAGPGDLLKPALEIYKAFQTLYHKARQLWQTDKTTVFPAGTYWLRRFANVAIAPPETL